MEERLRHSQQLLIAIGIGEARAILVPRRIRDDLRGHIQVDHLPLGAHFRQHGENDTHLAGFEGRWLHHTAHDGRHPVLLGCDRRHLKLGRIDILRDHLDLGLVTRLRGHLRRRKQISMSALLQHVQHDRELRVGQYARNLQNIVDGRNVLPQAIRDEAGSRRQAAVGAR